MNEWQPISTVPRDRPVLVWGPRTPGAQLGLPVIARWGKASHIRINGMVPYNTGDPEDASVLPATHWMDLPKPPSSGSTPVRVGPGPRPPSFSHGRGATVVEVAPAKRAVVAAPLVRKAMSLQEVDARVRALREARERERNRT